MIATCTVCGNFKVPWDHVGKELMGEHLKTCTKGARVFNALDMVFKWLRIERDTYQTSKFDYVEEVKNPPEWWDQQFASYIQRILLFPVGSLQHKQAALKLAATAVAYCEHLVEVDGIFPTPGVSSGTLSEWNHDGS